MMVSDGSSNSGQQSKVSEMLKRKVPPKRKSQGSSRSKSRTQDHEHSSSVMQELISKATGLGSSGRSTPSSSGSSAAAGGSGSSGSARSRFSSSSKTSSFLASLNPARWGRHGSSHGHAFAKDGSSTSGSSATAGSSLNSEHSSSSSLIAAGNREKVRQWIREHAIAFSKNYPETDLSKDEPSVLARLSVVIQNLDGNSDACLKALNDLKQILLVSDISPFEFNHSGLIKAMLRYMTADGGIVNRDDRLRVFLSVFAGLPLNTKG